MVVAEIDPSGRIRETILGLSLKDGQKFQHVVPAGSWFGAYLKNGGGFALVGCTVAPGFDFADFEMGERDKLLKEFPLAGEIIVRLT